MSKTFARTAALALTLAAMGAQPVLARGGSEDIDTAREELRAQLQASRTQGGHCSMSALLDMMFGGTQDVASAN